MFRHAIIAALTTLALAASASAQNAEYGTAEDARALLDRAVASMKEDPARTVAQINQGEGGFKDRDLYVFCFAYGKVVAHGNDLSRLGQIVGELKDTAGKAYGEEMLRVAEEGTVSEVSYMFRRPGPDPTPVPKISLMTKIADHICGVGHYVK